MKSMHYDINICFDRVSVILRYMYIYEFQNISLVSQYIGALVSMPMFV